MWLKYSLIVLYLGTVYSNITSVGKERKPLEAEAVAFATVVNLLIVIGIIYYWK